MKAWTVVGYTYRAENYTPAGILAALPTGPGEAFDGWEDMTHSMSVEDNLDEIAAAFGIDRQDESSFDSWDFPKVIFASDVDENEYAVDADGSYVEHGTEEDRDQDEDILDAWEQGARDHWNTLASDHECNH